jgi:toxin ParE1/3/4
MPNISRTSEAARDLSRIWRHIAQDNLSAAENWLTKVDGKLRLLSQFPGIGARREELGDAMLSYPFGHYLIFYRRTTDGIEIIRVLHGARDMRRLFARAEAPDDSDPPTPANNLPFHA